MLKNLSSIYGGVEDAASRSAKNGLFLNRLIEVGFDGEWITIVPYGSIKICPTEWKIVRLIDEIRKDPAM
jgi:hypothetical protein